MTEKKMNYKGLKPGFVFALFPSAKADGNPRQQSAVNMGLKITD